MILLDTCILLRVVNDGPLPAAVRAAMEREPWAVSALSAWEIAIKQASGKLALDMPAERWWPRVVAHYRLVELPFAADVALVAGGLPPLHADPFDRGIIACGVLRELAVATVDPVFVRYAAPCGLRLVG